MEFLKLRNGDLGTKEEIHFDKDTDLTGILSVIVPRQENVYVKVVDKKKMPLTLKLYIGGLSVIGLFIVYRMLQKSSRH